MIGLNYEFEQRAASGNPVRIGLIGPGRWVRMWLPKQK